MNDKPENRILWLFALLSIVFIVALSLQDLLHTPISWTEAKARIAQEEVLSIEIDGHLLRIQLKENDQTIPIRLVSGGLNDA